MEFSLGFILGISFAILWTIWALNAFWTNYRYIAPSILKASNSDDWDCVELIEVWQYHSPLSWRTWFGFKHWFAPYDFTRYDKFHDFI